MSVVRLAVSSRTYCVGVLFLFCTTVSAQQALTIYQAKKIITMEPSWPEGQYVAVRNDRIVAVGRSMVDLKAWTDAHPYTIDKTFAKKILMPGFVEAHLHLLLGALAFAAEFATPDDWMLPQGLVTGVQNKEAFMQRIYEGEKKLGNPSEWLFMFGYASAYHDEVTRADLDKVSQSRPIAVMSRSSHVFVLNSKAIELAGLTAEDAKNAGYEEYVDIEKGTFKEGGTTDVLLPKIARWLLAPERISKGLQTTKEALHANGVTTVHEPGSGAVSNGYPEEEIKTFAPVFNTPDTPMRTYLSARADAVFARFSDDEEQAMQFLNQLPKYDLERIKFLDKRAKLYVDGSYVDQVGIYNAPGYVDGHHGQMMTPEDKLLKYMRTLWAEDYAIHIHTMGDHGFTIAVNILQQLQNEKPRFNHGYVLEHVNAASPEDIRRAASLGASVSALIWPLFSVGEQFADKVLGVDRTYTGFPLKTILDNNMTLAIHADTVVSPPQPLLLAWMAINRTSASGRVLGENERISVDEALRAITIGPARILGIADEVGSIRAGKKADFVVLEKDPYKVNPKELKDIQIWGTVFEGKVYPAKY